MHSIWTGTIGFGLVNIPVKMYAATEESKLPFVQLDKNNQARIKYKKVNEATGDPVNEQDIVKGYKMGEHYVIIEEEDYKKATPEKMDYLEIMQFIHEKEIDAVYFEKPYYLTPAKGGERAYALLRDALKKEGKAALGPFVYHKREWIALIKPMDNVLVLHKLRFAQEIRSVESLALPGTTLKNDELKLAATLIEQLSAPFNPEKFTDQFSAKLLKVIEAKGKGKKGTFKHMKVVHTNTEDLMEKLKASMKTPAKKAS